MMNLRSFRRGPSFKITGSYRLEGYDDNLEPWLNSMKINGEELGPKFRATKLKIMVREPSKHNRKWSLTHKEEEGGAGESITYDFEPGKTFWIENADSSTEKILCTSNDNSVIICRAEVKKKSWDVETRIVFNPDGILCVVTNKAENVSMTANYKKLQDPWSSKKRKLLMFNKL